MSQPDFRHIKLSMVKDVVLVEVLSTDLQGPALAQEFGVELSTVAVQEWAHQILLDLRKLHHLSSTGFAALVKFVNQVQSLGKQVKFCNMDPDVKIGADIIGLGKVVELHADESSALHAFHSGDSGK